MRGHEPSPNSFPTDELADPPHLTSVASVTTSRDCECDLCRSAPWDVMPERAYRKTPAGWVRPALSTSWRQDAAPFSEQELHGHIRAAAGLEQIALAVARIVGVRPHRRSCC